MKEGPNIASIGALVGDPARANMLVALMSGKALTATELSQEAGVTLQTASSHLKKMETGGLIAIRKQGRHKYFSLNGDEVGFMLETLMGVARQLGHVRTQTGPKDPALRKARACYNHLAGEIAVSIYDYFISQNYLVEQGDVVVPTVTGQSYFKNLGFEIDGLINKNPPLCRRCLDWSERRTHLAGKLGAALLDKIYQENWAYRLKESRIIQFTPVGEQKLMQYLQIK